MRFVWNPAKWRPITKRLILLIASGTLSVQIDWVKSHVIPLLANHPHWASLGTGIILILGIIHNPVAAKVVETVFAEETTQNSDGTSSQVSLEATKTELPKP